MSVPGLRKQALANAKNIFKLLTGALTAAYGSRDDDILVTRTDHRRRRRLFLYIPDCRRH